MSSFLVSSSHFLVYSPWIFPQRCPWLKHLSHWPQNPKLPREKVREFKKILSGKPGKVREKDTYQVWTTMPLYWDILRQWKFSQRMLEIIGRCRQELEIFFIQSLSGKRRQIIPLTLQTSANILNLKESVRICQKMLGFRLLKGQTWHGKIWDQDQEIEKKHLTPHKAFSFLDQFSHKFS